MALLYSTCVVFYLLSWSCLCFGRRWKRKWLGQASHWRMICMQLEWPQTISSVERHALDHICQPQLLKCRGFRVHIHVFGVQHKNNAMGLTSWMKCFYDSCCRVELTTVTVLLFLIRHQHHQETHLFCSELQFFVDTLWMTIPFVCIVCIAVLICPYKIDNRGVCRVADFSQPVVFK